MELNYKNTDIDTCTRCEHCGEEIKRKDAIIKNSRVFCCSGCLGVSNLIHSLGLEEYYGIKDFDKHNKELLKTNNDKEDYSYLNQQNFIDTYTTGENRCQMDFYIEGIHCTGCLWLIENLSEAAEEIESVELNMSSSIATVRSKNDFSVFPALVNSLGYKAHPVKPGEAAKDIQEAEGKKLLYRIGIAGFCAGNIMLLSAAVYSGADTFFKSMFELVSAVLIIPVATYCAFPFYKNVINSISHKKADVDIAVVFIIIAGTLLSYVNLYAGGEIYFDSVAAFVFLLLLSRYVLRYFQNTLVRKRSGVSALFREMKVLKWDPGAGQYFLSPAAEVRDGDKVRFSRGDIIPFDGTSLSSNTYIDVAVLTGENYPKSILKGEHVYAGSKLESEMLTLSVISTGFDTRIGRILKKIDDGSFVNKNLSAFTDRYSTVFTFTVAAIALTFFTFSTFALGFSGSITRTISFILVSCPCAFIFVLPLTYSFSIKSGFEKGYIIRNLTFFENIKTVKNIFFDKTGTLTSGRFRILEWDLHLLSPRDLAAIFAIQSKSKHPISEAIRRYIKTDGLVVPEVDSSGLLAGKGYFGKIGDDNYEFLNEPISSSNDINQLLLTRINILKNGKSISEILFGDTLREDAKLTNNLINEMGINTFILSGDRKVNVFRAASKLGISEDGCYYEQSPEDKINLIATTDNSIMVGDGLNDSGALARASIGIATQGSVEQNLGASDVYLINKSLLTLTDIIRHGKATSAIIRNTVIASLVYNITAGSFALLGFISPLVAAVLMPSSSFLLLAISYFGQRKLRSTKRC